MNFLIAALVLGGVAIPAAAHPIPSTQTAPVDLDRLVRLLVPDATMLELPMKGTPPEIGDAVIFFASPTGKKLYAAAIGSLTASPGVSEAQAREAAMNAAMASLAADDYPALMAFGASGASQKMGSINPRIGTACRAWAERLIAENGERFRALQLSAAEDFRKNKQGGGQ